MLIGAELEEKTAADFWQAVQFDLNKVFRNLKYFIIFLLQVCMKKILDLEGSFLLSLGNTEYHEYNIVDSFFYIGADISYIYKMILRSCPLKLNKIIIAHAADLDQKRGRTPVSHYICSTWV